MVQQIYHQIQFKHKLVQLAFLDPSTVKVLKDLNQEERADKSKNRLSIVPGWIQKSRVCWALVFLILVESTRFKTRMLFPRISIIIKMPIKLLLIQIIKLKQMIPRLGRHQARVRAPIFKILLPKLILLVLHHLSRLQDMLEQILIMHNLE